MTHCGWQKACHRIEMPSKSSLLAVLTFALVQATKAHAICSGGTVAQEYKDASIVVRARLISETDAWDDEPSLIFQNRWGDGGLVSLYGLKVLQVFKGMPEKRVNIYMPHNSGAFYIDSNKDYLLFLNRIPRYKKRPTLAAGAFTIIYACGQSKPWTEVEGAALARLRQLQSAKLR